MMCHGYTGSKHCASADLDSSSVEPCSFSHHAFAWLKTHPCFAFDVLSRLLLRLVSSPCHPCPPDAYATLTGIDLARDQPLEISIRHLWKMKAAKDAGEEYHDPERDDNILGRNKTRIALWKEHIKDPIEALDKALKCVENSW